MAQTKNGTGPRTSRAADSRRKTRRKPETANRKRELRLFSSVEMTMVRRDLSALWRRKGIRALLMAMPAVLVVVIPLVYSVSIALLPITQDRPPAELQALLSAETAGHAYRQFWMDAFATLLCPLLFLTVPILCSAAAASCLFVGEKEDRTLETLLLSPMGIRSVFNTKVTVCVLVSAAVSFGYFIIFAITMSVADIVISAPYFFSVEWLVTLFLVMPSLAVFSVAFVTLLLPKLETVGEGIQTVGYLILPFAALFIFQFTGAYRVNVPFLLVLALLIAAAACILFNISARRFDADRLQEGSFPR